MYILTDSTGQKLLATRDELEQPLIDTAQTTGFRLFECKEIQPENVCKDKLHTV